MPKKSFKGVMKMKRLWGKGFSQNRENEKQNLAKV